MPTMPNTITLDDDALQMLKDFKFFMGDESYANHLAYKILELYEAQHGKVD